MKEKPTREKLIKLSETTPVVLVDIIIKLTNRIEELEERINKNSSNSNKPPSSDVFDKPKSLRKKTGKKPGRQPGHSGNTLKCVSSPDVTVAIPAGSCNCGCNRSLKHMGYESRQVFELPQPKLHVTEYKGEVAYCPCCSRVVRPSFPDSVVAPAQYGPRFQSLLIYLHHQQLLPSKRISWLCNDLFGQPVSEAVVFQATKKCYDQLQPFHTALIDNLPSVPFLHVDETGIRIINKLHWLHCASTDKLTFYGIHYI